MGIYIKGMEMPKVCVDCPFWETRYDPGYYNYEYCKALGKIFNECRRDINLFEEKLNDCPLVEIPTPHGRLIDADDSMKHLADDGREAFTKFQVWLLFSKYGARTILEAEE